MFTKKPYFVNWNINNISSSFTTNESLCKISIIIGMKFFLFQFAVMSFLLKFIIVLLAVPYWIEGLQTFRCGEEQLSALMKFDDEHVDINFTVGYICERLSDDFCIQSGYVYLQAGTCLTQYNSSTVAVVGFCPYFPNSISWLEAPFSTYYLLPSTLTLTEQSNLTCGPYNREGLLCSKCKPGYGPAVYSFSLVCAECSDNGVGWALYLFLVLFPITVFYIIVIIFNIRATAPPFTAFVLMCQVYCTIEMIHVPLQMRLKGMKSLSVIVQIVCVLCGIWNLDFFRYLIPPFCVSSHLSKIEALNLEYIHIMYPFLLILFTSIGIELHARNFRLIMWLWKPFHRVVTRLRRSWDPRASIINAFSTFFLLTLSKSIAITSNNFASTFLIVIKPTSTPIRYHSFLYTNPKICNHSKEHLPYLLCSILLLLVFFALPTLLLCLYPTKTFRKLLSHCLSLRWQHPLSTFIDTFQGHYKDGTNGTRDYRIASSIPLLLMFLLIGVLTGTNTRPLLLVYVQPIFVAVSLFYALACPCKQNYANIIQSLLYALTALVMILISSVKSHNHRFLSLLSMLLCLLIPHIVLSSYILYKVIGKAKVNCFYLLKFFSKLKAMKGVVYMMHHSPYPNEHSPLITRI